MNSLTQTTYDSNACWQTCASRGHCFLPWRMYILVVCDRVPLTRLLVTIAKNSYQFIGASRRGVWILWSGLETGMDSGLDYWTGLLDWSGRLYIAHARDVHSPRVSFGCGCHCLSVSLSIIHSNRHVYWYSRRSYRARRNATVLLWVVVPMAEGRKLPCKSSPWKGTATGEYAIILIAPFMLQVRPMCIKL